MFNPSYTVEGFAALPVLDGLNPDRLLRSVGIVYTTYSKEGHAVATLCELVGLNPDRLIKSVGIVIPLKVKGFSRKSFLLIKSRYSTAAERDLSKQIKNIK